MANKEDD